MKAYPEAKVILSLRDPNTWYESVKGTIYEQKALHEDFAVNLFMRMQGFLSCSECVVGVTAAKPEGMDKGDTVLIIPLGP